MRQTTWKTRVIWLALTLALCGGLLAGCSSTVEESEEPSPGADEDGGDNVDGAAGSSLVGQVASVGEDGTLTLSVYELAQEAADYVITDYAAVELSNYEDSGVSQEYLLDNAAAIQLVSDGVLADALAEDICVGDMVVIYTDDSAVETVIVYPAAEPEA